MNVSNEPNAALDQLLFAVGESQKVFRNGHEAGRSSPLRLILEELIRQRDEFRTQLESLRPCLGVNASPFADDIAVAGEWVDLTDPFTRADDLEIRERADQANARCLGVFQHALGRDLFPAQVVEVLAAQAEGIAGASAALQAIRLA